MNNENLQKQSKAEVKEYYIKQLNELIKKIENIPDEELKKLPAVHIPSLGFTEEMPKIAFYGIETNGWMSMFELKKLFNEEPSNAYDYITKTWFTPASIIRSAQPRKHIFWKYVISLLSSINGLSPKQLKTEDELKKNSFIWGNIKALEGFKVSAKRNGVKEEIYDEVYEKSAFLNKLPNGHFGPGYIIKACQPKLLFILDWRFKFKEWLKNEFNIENEKIHRYLNYAYIKETDTYIFQLPHPVFINRRIGWHKTIKQVLARLALDNQILKN